MSDRCLSRDREHLAGLQRRRRERMVRIDYMPSREALAAFQTRRAKERPGTGAATNSAILDAILTEWAELTGINYGELERPKSPGREPELTDADARARMTSGSLPHWLSPAPKPKRAPCGAKRHRDGQPCQALSEPGKRRCRFHGGRSTGPTTEAGKARALANLRQYRPER